jgi:hypothetical protein
MKRRYKHNRYINSTYYAPIKSHRILSKDDKFLFGKYQGFFVGSVMEEDFQWCYKNKIVIFNDEIIKLLKNEQTEVPFQTIKKHEILPFSSTKLYHY